MDAFVGDGAGDSAVNREWTARQRRRLVVPPGMKGTYRVGNQDLSLESGDVVPTEPGAPDIRAAWEDGFRAAMDGEAWNASDERIAEGAAHYVAGVSVPTEPGAPDPDWAERFARWEHSECGTTAHEWTTHLTSGRIVARFLASQPVPTPEPSAPIHCLGCALNGHSFDCPGVTAATPQEP